jgi:thioredoxin-dependent peroxiredoxin
MRTVTATAGATISGLIHAAMRRESGDRVALKPGDMAPDFELSGSDGRVYRLRDFRSAENVVIAWFPKAFTGGCTLECRSLGQNRGALAEFNARYFGASTDTAEDNRAFAESLQLGYPILSDPERNAARAYGVLGASGFATRWTFYIGKDGRILDIDKNVHPSSHGTDVARKLEELGIPRV